MYIDMCMDLYVDLCVGIRTDMRIYMCIGMNIGMCIGICIGMCIDMSVHMSIRQRSSVVYWPLLCVSAGIGSGAIGLGGGTITSPIMLEMGVRPSAAAI